MQVNETVKVMQQNNSEQLKAFAQVMFVSMLWHGVGLLDSDKGSKTKKDTNREKEQNTYTKNDASQFRN